MPPSNASVQNVSYLILGELQVDGRKSTITCLLIYHTLIVSKVTVDLLWKQKTKTDIQSGLSIFQHNVKILFNWNKVFFKAAYVLYCTQEGFLVAVIHYSILVLSISSSAWIHCKKLRTWSTSFHLPGPTSQWPSITVQQWTSPSQHKEGIFFWLWLWKIPTGTG